MVRGAEFYNSIFQNFLKRKNVHHYSRFTDKGPSLAERVIRTVRKILKKPILSAGNADWVSELPSVVKKENTAIHNSKKKIPNQAFMKMNEKEVYSNLRDDIVKQKPKYKLGQLSRTSDFKSVFSEGYSTNYRYEIYTLTEVIHDTSPSYRINSLPDQYD